MKTLKEGWDILSKCNQETGSVTTSILPETKWKAEDILKQSSVEIDLSRIDSLQLTEDEKQISIYTIKEDDPILTDPIKVACILAIQIKKANNWSLSPSMISTRLDKFFGNKLSQRQYADIRHLVYYKYRD